MSERLGLTPSQTVGPYLGIGLTWPDGALVVPRETPGAFRLHGLLIDGDGTPVPDGMVETWQADPDGRFDHPDDPRGAVRSAIPGFRGFGRALSDADGHWEVWTVRPGPLPAPDGGTEAPHLDVTVMARGLLDRLVTRVYLPDEPLNDTDPVLAALPPERRDTVVATRDGEGGTLRFDIRLQGPGETVFLRI